MEKGYQVTTRTIAEFLNKSFGTNYKKWFKSTYNIDESTTVWMIRIDGEKRQGFRNYYENGNIIEESNNEPTRSLKPVRMVFQIVEKGDYKTFIYLGKYAFDKKNSTTERRIFIPV